PVFKNRARALHELLAESVVHGERTYIATREGSLTFAEHAARVSSLAAALREEYGVRPGDRVAIAAANSADWIVTFWATVSIGAVSVGFNAWWTARELAHGVDNARPVLVVADAKRAASLTEVEVPVISIETDVPRLVASYPDAELPSASVAEDDPA